MMLERKLENDIVDVLKEIPELENAQVIGSRAIANVGNTKSEGEDKTSVVAVASGFRQNDAFSLSPITVPVSITIMTRVELDSTSAIHDVIVEKIADKISYWHKFGNQMSTVLSNDKFFAGELRMDGGSNRTFDSNNSTWTETLLFSIRGSEKFNN